MAGRFKVAFDSPENYHRIFVTLYLETFQCDLAISRGTFLCRFIQFSNTHFNKSFLDFFGFLSWSTFPGFATFLHVFKAYKLSYMFLRHIIV